MLFFSDELLTVVASSVKTLDSVKIDSTGGSRATLARLTNSLTTNTAVIYRFNADPDVTSGLGHRLEPGESVDVDGYDNLKNLKVALAGSVTAKVFVSYAH